jgi:hypothetical protein
MFPSIKWNVANSVAGMYLKNRETANIKIEPNFYFLKRDLKNVK